jgi:hypothetical protein
MGRLLLYQNADGAKCVFYIWSSCTIHQKRYVDEIFDDGKGAVVIQT